MPLGEAFLRPWKCFIPRRESAKAEPVWGSIVFTYVLFLVREGFRGFQICSSNWPFWSLENVLSPEGRYVVYPVGVQLRLFPFIEFWVSKGILDFQNPHIPSAFLKPWKCFIPRRDCESSTVGGPIVFYLCIISVRKRIWYFQNPNIPSAFLSPWKFFIYGRMDGWDGRNTQSGF